MPFYHATTKDRIASIQAHGLGGNPQATRAFPDAPPGVYLSKDPLLSVGFLIERTLTGEFKHLTPREALEQFVVVVIDDSRVNPAKLRLDPAIAEWKQFFLYDGIVDVNAMPIVPAETIAEDWKAR